MFHMAFELYIALVTALSLVYVGIAKVIQDKLTDKKAMAEMQAESKRLNQEFDDAKKRNDKKKMDEVMQQQMEFLPKMNKVMFSQFKPMFAVLGIFLVLTWAVGQIDPSVKDDIHLSLMDDGKDCDLKAGDGIFSGCYALENNATVGKWQFTAISHNENGGEIGRNSTLFLVGVSSSHDNYTDAAKGEPVGVSTDKPGYSLQETAKLYVYDPKASSVSGILDNGTVFFVDLPFSIPLINVQRIYQPYWWFIFISLIANLGVTLGMGILNKKKDGKGNVPGSSGAKK
jgi:hypothetical protein